MANSIRHKFSEAVSTTSTMLQLISNESDGRYKPSF